MRRFLLPMLLLAAAAGFISLAAMRADCACAADPSALSAAKAAFHLAVFF